MLIATNCVVFLFQTSMSTWELNRFLVHFALIPARYFDLVARGTIEEGLSKIFLESLDLQADRAGSQPDLVGGGGKTSTPQDGVERTEECKFH